jgi:hypothetical protein
MIARAGHCAAAVHLPLAHLQPISWESTGVLGPLVGLLAPSTWRAYGPSRRLI